MKRNLLRAAFAAVMLAATLALLPSCKENMDNCTLIVRNKSSTDGDEIRGIHVQKKGESGFTLKYSEQSIKKGDYKYFWYDFPEDSYTFKLSIYRENGWDSTTTKNKDFDLGYHNYRKFEEDGTVTIIFDGTGCYFDE